MRKQALPLIAAALGACSSKQADAYWRVDLEAADGPALAAQIDRLHAERAAWPDVVIWKGRAPGQDAQVPGYDAGDAFFWLGRTADTVLFRELTEFGEVYGDIKGVLVPWCAAHDLPFCIEVSQATWMLVPKSQFERAWTAAEQDQSVLRVCQPYREREPMQRR